MKDENYIRFDWAAKRLLRNKANFDVLEGFLTTLLQENIHIIEILESESNQQEENDKFNRVDIKAKNDTGDIIIVEIQNTRELYYLEHILYGVAKAITEHINLGENYSSVKKVYSISIIYFDIGKGKDYLYRGYSHFRGLNTGDELEITVKEKSVILKKTPDKIFPEYYLIRVSEFNKLAVTPLEEWIDYLKTGHISSESKAPGLPEAREKLRYYNMGPDEKLAYDRHLENIMIQNDILSSAKKEGHQEGWEEGLEKGFEKGIEKGIEKGKITEQRLIATNLKQQKVAFETIALCTGLSIEEINTL